MTDSGRSPSALDGRRVLLILVNPEDGFHVHLLSGVFHWSSGRLRVRTIGSEPTSVDLDGTEGRELPAAELEQFVVPGLGDELIRKASVAEWCLPIVMTNPPRDATKIDSPFYGMAVPGGRKVLLLRPVTDSDLSDEVSGEWEGADAESPWSEQSNWDQGEEDALRGSGIHFRLSGSCEEPERRRFHSDLFAASFPLFEFFSLDADERGIPCWVSLLSTATERDAGVARDWLRSRPEVIEVA